jgi:hypothetical protein
MPITAPTIDPSAGLSTANLIAQMNASMMPNLDAEALRSTITSGTAINKAQADVFYGNLSNVLPDWKGVMASSSDSLAKSTAVANQLLSGELPDDVKASIERSRAELGLSRGLFGEAAQMGTARDLGLTSLQMVQSGLKAQADVISPLTTALLKNALALTPPSVDFASIFKDSAAALRATSMVSADTAYKTGAQIAIENAKNAWEATMSEFNASREDAFGRVAMAGAGTSISGSSGSRQSESVLGSKWDFNLPKENQLVWGTPNAAQANNQTYGGAGGSSVWGLYDSADPALDFVMGTGEWAGAWDEE